MRSLVIRLRGCLASLDPGAQKLLSLRAGLSGAPRNATAVARILHVGLQREQLLEQLALADLQRSAASGCPGVAATQTASSASTVLPAGLTITPPWMGTAPPAPLSAIPAAIHTAAASGSSSTAGVKSAPHGSHGGSVVVVTPAASRTVERAGAGSSLPTAAIPAFAALALGLCLIALPGVRRRLLMAPGSGTTGASRRAGAGPAAGAAGRRGANAVPMAAAVGAAAAVAASTSANPKSQVEPEAGPGTLDARATTAPSPASPSTSGRPSAPAAPRASSATPAPSAAPASGATSASPATPNGSGAAAGSPAPNWARQHAGQAAVVATVVAGGVARVLSRARHRR